MSTAPFAEFPAIDLGRWRSGTGDERDAVAAEVDHALRHTGFMLLTGHGIDFDLPARVRELCRTFFHFDTATKQPYRSTPGFPGWQPTGVEANAYASGQESPPDLKETLNFGPAGERPIMVSTVGPIQCTNVFPAEVPDMAAAIGEYTTAAGQVAAELFELLAEAIGAPEGTFTDSCGAALHSLSVTWYPSRATTGEPDAGQYRIGPHTDFGTITLLDREPGVSGLQVQTLAGDWVDAPFVPGSLTINIGDLMARWSGDRWRSNMHRVLAPSTAAPAEELISLVLFVEADLEAVITPLPPPIGGGGDYEPVSALQYLVDKLNAISVG
ncbi:MAG: 2-oxoglutarate and iron-dependent oxygenase domain-containing protein [Ilumatobacteraceae bacterium]